MPEKKVFKKQGLPTLNFTPIQTVQDNTSFIRRKPTIFELEQDKRNKANYNTYVTAIANEILKEREKYKRDDRKMLSGVRMTSGQRQGVREEQALKTAEWRTKPLSDKVSLMAVEAASALVPELIAMKGLKAINPVRSTNLFSLSSPNKRARSSIKSSMSLGGMTKAIRNTYNEHREGLRIIKETLRQEPKEFKYVFPITKKQKIATLTAQKNAHKEARDFLDKLYYTKEKRYEVNAGKISKVFEEDVIRPEVKEKISKMFDYVHRQDINDNLYRESRDYLFSSRRGKGKELRKLVPDYDKKYRSKIGGVNKTLGDDPVPYAITIRNVGLAQKSPKKIYKIALHEGTHSAQYLGPYNRYERNNLITMADWVSMYNPVSGYYSAYPGVPFGKRLAAAMVKPTKETGWVASPLELHADYNVERGLLYKELRKIWDDDKSIAYLHNLDDDMLDTIIKNGNLDKFFKPNLKQSSKRKILRELYTGIPIAGSGYVFNKQLNKPERNKKVFSAIPSNF